MMTKIKKMVSLVLCIALLGTLMIMPASASTGTGWIMDETFDTTSVHFTGSRGSADLGGLHGAVMQLQRAGAVDGVISPYVTRSATLTTEKRDMEINFDIMLCQTTQRYSLVVMNSDKSKVQSCLTFDEKGRAVVGANGTDLSTAAIATVDSHAQKATVAGMEGLQTIYYETGKWHKVTIYYDYRDSGTSYLYTYLDGQLVRQTGIGDADSAIGEVKFVTGTVNVGGLKTYVDNFTLSYMTTDNFYATAQNYEGQIYVDFSQYINGVTGTTFSGTTVKNKYTGEVIADDDNIVSYNGRQIIIEPDAKLIAGAEYEVSLPNVMRYIGGGTAGETYRPTTNVLNSRTISFIATADDYWNVWINDNCSENKFKTSDESTAVTLEDGAVKVEDTNTSASVEVHYCQDGTNAGVTTTSTKSTYLDASLAFKPAAVATYGHILFEFNGTNRYNFKIRDTGKVHMASDANATNNGAAQVAYNVGEWNTLGIRYDRTTKLYTAYVNGAAVYTTTAAMAGDAADTVKIYYFTDKAATNTTIYFDNVYVANSATGVSDVKVATKNVWTKDSISATDATATVIFDGALAADYTGSADNFVLTTEGSEENMVSAVAISADKKTATLTLSDDIYSGKEYTLEVKGIADSAGATIVPYTAKFTTKDFAISNLELSGTDTLTATATIDGRADATVIIAQYANGKLIKVTPVQTTLSTGMESIGAFEPDTTATGAVTYKAFVWDNMTNLKPLCDNADL